MNGPKIYFEIPIFGGIPITQTAVSSFVVMLLLCIAGYFLGKNLKKRPGRMQVMTEKMVSMESLCIRTSGIKRIKDSAEHSWVNPSTALTDSGRSDFNSGGTESPI